MRQVTHALLTRPPLSHKNRHSEEIQSKCFARLACVKHAASVHPEPGSNSRKKSSLSVRKTTSFPIPLFTVGIRPSLSLDLISVLNISLRNFQGRCLLFSYQGSLFSHLSDNFCILSCRFRFVNNFFSFFLLSLLEEFFADSNRLHSRALIALLSSGKKSTLLRGGFL